MMEDLERLMAICPPPAEEQRVGSFQESPMGALGVPRDYRKLIASYGAGCFDDFLWVYGEGEGNSFLRVESRTESARSALGRYVDGDFGDFLAALGVSVGDLIQWGGTDNGDMLLWVPVGEIWPVLIVSQRPLEYLLLPVSSTRLVQALLAREVVTSIFPPDFPSERITFRGGSLGS